MSLRHVTQSSHKNDGTQPRRKKTTIEHLDQSADLARHTTRALDTHDVDISLVGELPRARLTRIALYHPRLESLDEMPHPIRAVVHVYGAVHPLLVADVSFALYHEAIPHLKTPSA